MQPMANLNKVMLIGRLTRDPETRAFAGGGKVVAFGFAVTNKKKNQSTGQWEDEPMFIDAKIFGRPDNSRQADLLEQSLRKGSQVYLEGKLVFEQWDDKTTGQKRSKHALVIDNFQFLEPRQDGGGGNYSQRRQPAAAPMSAGPSDGGYDDSDPGAGGPHAGAAQGGGEDIPF